MVDELTIKNNAKSIVMRLEQNKGFSIEEIRKIQRKMGQLEAVVEILRACSADTIAIVLQQLEIFGSAPNPEKPPFEPAYLFNYINQKPVIAFWVELLENSNPEVQRQAMDILVGGNIPVEYIRNNISLILTIAKKFPSLPDMALLLGLTGCEEAKTLIENNSEISSYSEISTTMALARLGNFSLERKLIDSYRNAKPGREKEDAAHRLGYLGTPNATLILSLDMRTEERYIWMEPFAKRSMRVHIIESLHRIFPKEPVFWKPLSKPTNDAYYEIIEQWLHDNIGVTWVKTRPDFLYEEDAPIIPRQ
jgi:hypothetical protein